MLTGLALLFVAVAQWGSADQETWRYPIEQVRVVDGDTYDLMINLGFDTIHKVNVRLDGYDAAEIRRGPADLREHGRAATRYVEEWVDLCRPSSLAVVLTDFSDKYGRAVGDLACGDSTVGEALLEERLVVPYGGGSRAEVQDDHRANMEWRAANRDDQP